MVAETSFKIFASYLYVESEFNIYKKEKTKDFMMLLKYDCKNLHHVIN